MVDKGKGKAVEPPVGSLSSIVSSLVRAQHGIPKSQVPDENLDKCVTKNGGELDT